jgi:membrane fusion protein, multidrug efflux system
VFRSKKYRLEIMLVLGGLIAATLCISGCGDAESGAKVGPIKPKEVRVEVLTVQPVTLRDEMLLPAETEAIHDVCLAAKRDGQVEWIGPREGDAVDKDQLIATIDVAALKADLDRCKATSELAAKKSGRRESLHKRGIISQEALDQSLTETTQATCNLRQATVNYEHGFVRSPISGVINRLHVDPGEFVKRGALVADLVDVKTIRVNVRVPEMDIRYLKVGQKADVTIDAYPGEKWQGAIDFVAFKADPATKTFKARVVVENSDGRIRPGMIAHVAFLRRLIPDALVVPLFAILDKGGERLVFVEKDGMAGARTVTIGVIDGDRAQIVKGLEAGDNLIVKGRHDVEEGMRVSTK